MDILLLIIGILILLTAAVLALRLRVHLELSEERKTVFFGLGRSGPFIDFDSGVGKFRLFGFNLRSFKVQAVGDDDEDEDEETEADIKPAEPAVEERESDADRPGDSFDEGRAKPHEAADTAAAARRRRRFRLPSGLKPAWRLFSHSTKATGRYLMRLFRGTRVEHLEARIRGGFEEPDQTGQAYGYFQAVSGAVPFVRRHVKYSPDFTGQSLSGSFRIGVALPLYRLVGSTLLFLWDLPLRELIRLAIGKKKGADDVK